MEVNPESVTECSKTDRHAREVPAVGHAILRPERKRTNIVHETNKWTAYRSFSGFQPGGIKRIFLRPEPQACSPNRSYNLASCVPSSCPDPEITGQARAGQQEGAAPITLVHSIQRLH